MMLLPPQSGRKALRLANATIVSEISQIYGILISSWLTVEEETEENRANGKEGPDSENKPVNYSYEKWKPAFRAKLMTVAGALAAQKMQMATVKWEG